MYLRRLIPALLVAPLLAVAAPRVADACSPPSGFTVQRSFPAADAVDVRRGINIVVVGEDWGDGNVKITVRQDGAPVEGTMFAIANGRYRWDPGETLLPDTVYDVSVASWNVNLEQPLVVHDFSFTTGPKLSGAPVSPTIKSAAVEVFEREVKECVLEGDGGSCEGCLEWEVVGVEQRLRLAVEVEQPVGVYDGFYGSVLEWGVAPEVVGESGHDSQYQGPEGGSTRHVVDLGLVGEYPGSQVCINVAGNNPVDGFIIVADQPDCIDVSELNVPPEGETDTGDSEDGPTTGGESGGSSGDESGQLEFDGDAGCGCRSNTAPGGSLALLALVFGVVRPRRRVR
jgi:MYXO-CTERM domain-containing protein